MTKRSLFCNMPFSNLRVRYDGLSYACCTRWLPPIGESGGDPLALWKSQKARELRESILDGSFRHCPTRCQFLSEVAGPVMPLQEAIDSGAFEKFTKSAELGPTFLGFGLDRSCNLKCPSCRSEHIVATEEQNERDYEIMSRHFDALGSGLEWLQPAMCGDPFVSKPARRLLERLRVEDYPKLKIMIHTNGLLFTPANWEKWSGINSRVQWLHISIDAATPETYALNRGGSWDVLQRNLEYIASLRRDGPVKLLEMSFVVQENNFHEMPDFIHMAARHGADVVILSAMADWDAFSPEEYRRRAVHLPEHPRHQDLRAVLKDAIFDRPSSPMVSLGALSTLRVPTADAQRRIFPFVE